LFIRLNTGQNFILFLLVRKTGQKTPGFLLIPADGEHFDQHLQGQVKRMICDMNTSKMIRL